MRNITTAGDSNYSTYNRCPIPLKGGRAIRQNGTGYASNEIDAGLAKGISVGDTVADTVPSVIAFGLIALIDIATNVNKGDMLMAGNNTAEGKLVTVTIGKYGLAIAREDGLANTTIRADIISPTRDTSGTGVSTFIDLTDTINNYTGKGLDVLRVNSGENQIESKDLSLLDLDDTTANNISYDNIISGLTATEVQSAIDELSNEKVDLTQQTRQFWVAIDGNDTTGNGSKYKPYRTIGKAVSMCGSLSTVIWVGSGQYTEPTLSIAHPKRIAIKGIHADTTSLRVNNGTVLSLSGTNLRLLIENMELVCDSNNAGHYIINSTATGGSGEIKFINCAFQDWYIGTQHCQGIKFANTSNVDFLNSWVFLNGDGLPLELTGSSYISFTLSGAFTGANHACVVKDSSILKCSLSKFFTWHWAEPSPYNAINHAGSGLIELNNSDLEAMFSSEICKLTGTGTLEFLAGKMLPDSIATHFDIGINTTLKLGAVQCNLDKITGAGTVTRLLDGRLFEYANLPTSNVGLSPGEIFTRTAAQLGGVGATKVICVV